MERNEFLYDLALLLEKHEAKLSLECQGRTAVLFIDIDKLDSIIEIAETEGSKDIDSSDIIKLT